MPGIQLFREKLSDESVKLTRQDFTVRSLGFEWIFHTSKEEIYKFVFFQVKYWL